MKPYLLILMLISISSPSMFGNTAVSRDCPSNKMQGFKLGMTLAEAEKKAGRKLGLIDILGLPSEFQAAGFNRMNKLPPYKINIGLGFYNGIVYSISSNYDDSIRWHNIDAFTTWLSPSLKLKPIWTNIFKWNGSLEMSGINCSDMQITATKLTYNQGRNQARPFSVTLRDKVVTEKESKIREAAEKAKQNQLNQ